MIKRTIVSIAVSAFVGLLAGCGNDAAPAAVEAPRSTVPAASAATNPAPVSQRATASDILAYAEVDGMLARGYFSYPTDMVEPLPAILLIHDWFGLDAPMMAVADGIAAQGFVVLAVDLFDGKTGQKPADTREALVRMIETPAIAEANLGQAITFLREHVGSPRLAIMGFGSGGLWSLNRALATPDEFRALVVVQGQTLTDVKQLGGLKMPVLGIYGAADRSIRPEAVRAFGDALVDADVSHEIRLYPKAGSAFMLSGSRNFSATQAQAAWTLIFEFLTEQLASSDSTA